MPRPVLALPWGSASTISTRLPQAASAVARLTAVVVLPTPPFWLASAMMRAGRGDRLELAATVTLDLRQTQDGPRRVGSAGESLDLHPPCFGRLGQFLAGSNSLVKQRNRARPTERLGEVEKRIERRHGPPGHQ